MAKFGFDERRLFNISEQAFENLVSTPSDPDSGQMLVYIKSDHLYIKKPSVSEVIIPETASNVGSGAQLFKQKNSSGELEFRTIVSADGHLDITQNANEISLYVDFSDINDELDHGALLGLGDDDHTQYLLLAGRSGGQIANGGTAASENLELRSTAHSTKGAVQIIDGSEFQLSDTHYKQYVLQTTDATLSTIATIPLSDDRVYNVKARIVARRSDGGGQARAAWELRACAYRAAGGGATLQGAVQYDFQNRSSGSINADINMSGNNMLVQVQGVASQTFEFKLILEYTVSN